MAVQEIVTGKLVKVTPDALDAKDVIELAEALIEEHGHVKQTGGDANAGWSIHGAIGEAAKLATGSSGKDSGEARPLRNEAAQLIQTADPQGRTEIEVNDQAQHVDEVLLSMRAARGA